MRHGQAGGGLAHQQLPVGAHRVELRAGEREARLEILRAPDHPRHRADAGDDAGRAIEIAALHHGIQVGADQHRRGFRCRGARLIACY